MAYHVDGTDIVIDGWEKGISDNPQQGINDMRGVNIISVPGEVSVSFKQNNIAWDSCSGSVTSADAVTDIITVTISSGSLNTSFGGQSVVFTGASLPTGITAGTIYWAVPQNSTSMTIYNNPGLTGSPINITATGTGTFTTINIKDIKYFDKSSGVGVDSSGRAWGLSNGFYTYLGNPVSGTAGLSGTNGNGIIYYRGYLFVFYNSRICYTPFSINSLSGISWVNEWNPVTGAVAVGTAVFNTATGANNPHESIISSNKQGIYITDSNYICSLLPVIDTSTLKYKTFDPADTTTYIWTNTALILPQEDTAICLEELGNNLLIGGTKNVIYPWDKTSTGYDTVIKIADNYIYHLLTVNTNTYIFAGRRGRIYVTSGSQANLYSKIPDNIAGIEPIFTWGNCCYNKNQIYFGVYAQNNLGSFLSSYSGLWAIDITTESLRVPTLQSTADATVSSVFASTVNQGGFSLIVSWYTFDINGNLVSAGIDTSDYKPYTSYISYIETDLIPVGQFLKKKTFENIEFKLAVPMVNGEAVKISFRTNKSENYTIIQETTYTYSTTNPIGPISDYYLVNFEQSQWIQFKIEMKSTVTNPSYVRLTELRLKGIRQE